jgi:uncharacterized membrane-anchored protein
MTRLKLAAAWTAIQLLFFVGWTYREETRLTSGPSILVRVVPVDPRDLLRGQYLTLGYEFSRDWDSMGAGVRLTSGTPVWVVLRPDAEFYVPARLSPTAAPALGPGEVALKGRVSGGRYVFGVERYFVPEGSATPPASDLTVRLRVGSDGAPRIEQVYVKGVAWP